MLHQIWLTDNEATLIKNVAVSNTPFPPDAIRALRAVSAKLNQPHFTSDMALQGLPTPTAPKPVLRDLETWFNQTTYWASSSGSKAVLKIDKSYAINILKWLMECTEDIRKYYDCSKYPGTSLRAYIQGSPLFAAILARTFV